MLRFVRSLLSGRGASWRLVAVSAVGALRVGWRLVIAAVIATALLVVASPEVAWGATIDQQVTRDVTLDAPGTATIEAFDPAQGTLTQVSITIEVGVLVQACVENRQAEVSATSGGTVSGRLAVELPAGDLTAGNGSDDCTGGFAADAGRFPAPVSASDVAYAEDTGQASTTATLTASADLAPFIGTGTVTITHTPANDSELTVPAEWDAVSVATGTYEVAVTYTYTPAPAATPRSSTGSSTGSVSRRTVPLSRTGASAVEEVLVAAGLLVLGATVVVLASRRRRVSGS